MNKFFVFGFLILFINFFFFRGLFSSLDSYTPNNTSGNPFAVFLAIAVTILFLVIVCMLLLIEKVMEVNLKNTLLCILLFHCLFHFVLDSFFEYDLFHDTKSFSLSAIIIILIYFIVELFLTFYLVSKMYKSSEEM
ncbi:hypothetical protein SAMN06265346_102238 [Flavobacterium hercynium]|uniref:Uncharacterized protein n=1 Tax=Flavobacterium hercynium TaxID=387094 RepID=A0A226HL84_9FLAO|nr:hypothetical protein B0A66_04050 [Flavobacterium hercynium]SMP09278.1 hypothetical protein SAMN06265346_102238 [Flavobacterium hercynium]